MHTLKRVVITQVAKLWNIDLSMGLLPLQESGSREEE
jgi:hypothetical protein